MATGVLRKEKLSKDALFASEIKSEPWDLPNSSVHISLEYENKVSKEDVLNLIDHDYVSFNCNMELNKIDEIPLNSFILDNNIYGLKKLCNIYAGKIKLIYLDPPYGTGMEFQSRSLEHAYQDIYGTAAWSEMMRRRLIIMRELLSSDGTIYVHIGHQMLFHLKVIMDEVFGSGNFRNLITRRKCSSKNSTRKQFPNLHDYVLFYSKSKIWLFNQPSVPAKQEWIEKEYTKKDARGLYKLVPIHAPGHRNGETGKEWRGMMPPPGKHWQFTPDRLESFEQHGEMHWSKTGNPRRKVYLEDDKKVPITDLWDLYRDAHHQSKMITGYPTEKNLDMLKMIVEASTNEGDIVLDPFCGSGTTLHAARDLKRNWLGIDQSFTAAKATVKRMKYGLEKMGDYVNEKKSFAENVNLFGGLKDPIGIGFNFVIDADVYDHYKNLVQDISSI